MRVLMLLTMTAAAGCAKAPLAPMKGDGVLNATHGKYVDKIVFSRAAIDRDQPDEGAFSSTFSDADPIYARFYLDGPIANEMVKDEEGQRWASDYDVKLQIDNRPVEWDDDGGNLAGNPDLTQASTRQILLNPGDHRGSEKQAALQRRLQWSKVINALPQGRHAVRVEVWTRANQWVAAAPAAVGEFTLERGAVAKASGLTFDALERGKVDAPLEAKLLDGLRALEKREGWDESIERVSIIDADWVILRNDLTGVVTSRGLRVNGLVRKKKGGGCGYVVYEVAQQHDGQGFVGPFVFQLADSPGGELECGVPAAP